MTTKAFVFSTWIGDNESKHVRINEQCQNKRRNKYKEFKNQIIITQAHAMFY